MVFNIRLNDILVISKIHMNSHTWGPWLYTVAFQWNLAEWQSVVGYKFEHTGLALTQFHGPQLATLTEEIILLQLHW